MDKKDNITVFCTYAYSKAMYIKYNNPIYVIFILVSVLLSSCIEDFTPKGAIEINGILVVDGIITNGESVFTLRKSVKMSEELPKNEEMVDDASLNIECSDGVIMPGEFTTNGKYRVQTSDLDPDKEYRLNFTIGEEVYQSAYLPPLTTTEVDSISYRKQKAGAPVSIHVSTHDAENRSPYYRWTYTETWEVKADMIASVELVDGKLIGLDVTLKTPHNIYYCWGKQDSYTLLLESTKKLSTNAVNQKKLIEIPCGHDKLSILYHVSVKQTQIRQEAYEYFAVLQNTVEQTGGLFSPVLSAGMEGNIRCLSDPDIPVIGYVEVATTSIKERFIDDRSLYEPAPVYCPLIDDNNRARHALAGHVFAHISLSDPPSMTYIECVDCRSRANNPTKNKPEWWPTDHL